MGKALRRHSINLVCGAVLTGLTMLVPYQYCMDGPGRGFPVAVYSPLCGAWLPVFAFDHKKIPQVLDLGGLLAGALIWGAGVAFVRSNVFSDNESAAMRGKTK